MSTRIEIKAECATAINVLIQNCCDPLIQEIISFDTPGLPPIGGFLDFDGNCWRLMNATESPINAIRLIRNTHGSCELCIEEEACPENLIVESCCANFGTVFSGALPGIIVGDTFLDTFGFCWTVTGTTPTPINGLVSVNTVYSARDCVECLNDNICPDIYGIKSCCKSTCDGTYFELYTTLALLGGGSPGETFVDQFGFCWRIGLVPEVDFTLLTGSFIQYASASIGPCGIEDTPCTNACDTNVFYTIQNCFTLQVEVIEYSFGLPINSSIFISFTTVLSPKCYKVIGWDNTSLPTKIVDSIEGCFRTCEECLIG